MLADVDDGWPGHCSGLSHSNLPGVGLQECKGYCTNDPLCSVWLYRDDGCWYGQGLNCGDAAQAGSPAPLGGQRIMHGDVRKLMDLRGLQVLNLHNIGLWELGNAADGIERCKDYCYSDLHCQFWQYGAGGCWVDSRLYLHAPIQYPLTLNGGASRVTEFAKHIVAGEYVQHFCPPRALRYGFTPYKGELQVGTAAGLLSSHWLPFTVAGAMVFLLVLFLGGCMWDAWRHGEPLQEGDDSKAEVLNDSPLPSESESDHVPSKAAKADETRGGGRNARRPGAGRGGGTVAVVSAAPQQAPPPPPPARAPEPSPAIPVPALPVVEAPSGTALNLPLISQWPSPPPSSRGAIVSLAPAGVSSHHRDLSGASGASGGGASVMPVSSHHRSLSGGSGASGKPVSSHHRCLSGGSGSSGVLVSHHRELSGASGTSVLPVMMEQEFVDMGVASDVMLVRVGSDTCPASLHSGLEPAR